MNAPQFTPLHGGPDEPPAAVPAARRIHRHILCSFGAPAHALAQRVLELSHCGMADPPLEHLAAPQAQTPGGGDREFELLTLQMEQACDRLADSAVALRRRRQGFEFAAPDELHVWLLINLAPAGSGAAPTEPANDAGVTPEVLARSQEILQQTAWLRLRAHIAWHAVLLLEAAAQPLLLSWVEALRGGEVQLYVMSPVNAEHLRLADHDWRERAAQTAAALLWVAPPPHTAIERATTGFRCLAAVAADVWCSPAAQLHAWLAQAGAAEILRIVTETAPTAASTGPDSPSLDEDVAALQRKAPPVRTLPTHSWRPGWGEVAQLPAAFAAEMERTDADNARRFQQARLAWLDQAQDLWGERLAALEAGELLSPVWPQVAQHLASLQALRRLADELAQAVGERLELIGTQLEQAAQADAAAALTLETLCCSLPGCSLQGLTGALLQPWRWPRWAFDYWQRLPDCVRRWRSTHEAASAQQREEAAWHTLRQHYLAAAQQVQVRIVRTQQIQQHLAAAYDLAAAACTQQAEHIGAPWSPARLARLRQRLLADVTAVPVRDILQSVLRRENTPAETVMQLAERSAAQVGEAAGWSALDCLYAAFTAEHGWAPSMAVATLRDADAWLEQMLHAATPLWPAQELADNALMEDWYVAPGSRAQAEPPGGSVALLESWHSHFAHLLAAESALDAVQVIRWSEVRIDLETRNLRTFSVEDLPHDEDTTVV